MKKFTLKQGDLYYGNDEIGKSLKGIYDAQVFFDSVLINFLRDRPKFKEYIDLYGKIHGLDRYAFLAAHGYTNGKWGCFDGKKEYTVQSWIDRVDGRYSGLLLCVCNPGNHTPKSKKSILVIPDRNVGPAEEAIFSLLDPRLGEVDSYTIDCKIKQLSKELQR